MYEKAEEEEQRHREDERKDSVHGAAAWPGPVRKEGEDEQRNAPDAEDPGHQNRIHLKGRKPSQIGRPDVLTTRERQTSR